MSYIGCPIWVGGITMTYQCVDNSCGSGCDCEYDAYDVLEQKLLGMTFLAHKTVLFEKIKQKIETEEGKKLDQLAELLVEASREKWKTEQEATKKADELREKIRETFEA